MRATPRSLEELIWQIRRAFRELGVAADAYLGELGIQVGDRAMLEFLAREPGPISLSDLARKRAVSRQHIHQALRRLPHPGWVEQTSDPADRRAVLLRLSPQGRAFWRRVRAADEAVMAGLAAGLTAAEVQQATRAIAKLRRRLRPPSEGEDDGRGSN